MKKRTPFQISLLLVCLLWLNSCIKDDISVKDLDGTMGIKGAVVLPVAKSTITFKDFIQYLDPKYISEDPQSVFVLKYTPKSYDFDVHLDPGNVPLAPQPLSLAGYSGNVSASQFNNILQSEIGSVEIDLRQINTQIIQQLDSILTTSFSIDVALNYSGINLGTNKLRITLMPDQTFAGAQSSYMAEKTASELNISKVFTISFANVRLKPVNNKIKFQFLIEALPNPTSNLVLSTTPSFSYGITARDIKYTAAFGQFNFSQPSQTGTIDISELNQFLNADSYLPYAEPKLTLDVATNARLPLVISLDYLRSYSLSAPSQYYYAQFGGSAATTFPLAKMPVFNKLKPDTARNPIVLSKDNGKIDQLFAHRGIDAIDYAFGVNTTGGITDQFVMSASMFRVAPTVEIPLSFGPGAEIAIKDTVSLGDSFSSFLEDNDIEKVGVLLTINNYTSASMILSMVLQDAAHNNISGEKKITLTANSTADQSFSLPFTSTELKTARYILLNYKMQAKDVQSTLTIKSTDFLKARVGVYVKGSVTF